MRKRRIRWALKLPRQHWKGGMIEYRFFNSRRATLRHMKSLCYPGKIVRIEVRELRS